MIRILLDIKGGDHPEENLKAIELMQGKHDDLEIVPVDGSIAKKPVSAEDAAMRAGMSDSIYESLIKLKSGEYDGFVSMGDTRDLMIGVMNLIGLQEGVVKPALCPIVPTLTRGVVGVCDSGAIMKVTPEQLLQYAKLGSEFISRMTGKKNPRVALLNVGIKENKGDELHREAYKLLKAEQSINFAGNVEAMNFNSGEYDLIVSDGFSGNIMLKAIEGVSKAVLNRYGKYIPKEGLEFMDYRNYAAAAVLGTEQLIIKVQGFGDSMALVTAIEQAYQTAKNSRDNQQ